MAKDLSHGGGWMAVTGSTTPILLARHGQTPLSVQRRYSGHGDPELTELGHAQAQATADALAGMVRRPDGENAIGAIVTSPLRRCLVTAELLAAASGAEVHVEERIIETDFGRWEGLTFSEAAAQDPDVHRAWIGDPSLPAPGGESFDQVAERVLPALDHWAEQVAGRTLVVVSHVTPIKLALQQALAGGPEFAFRLHLDLAQISEMRRYGDGGVSVHRVNDTAHLAGLG